MKIFKQKLKLLYIPFLVIGVSFIVLYTLLNWLLFIKNDLFPVKENILTVWLPMLLPFVPVLIFLRPRVKLLRFKNENASFLYQCLAVAAIAAPTLFAQQYLSTASGKLTQLGSISQFEAHNSTKYFTVKNYFIDKGNAGVLNTATVTGKHNNNLNFFIYLALPLLNSPQDSVKGECSFFVGSKYSKTVSNSLSDEEKDAAFNSFAAESQREFEAADFQQFVYLEKIPFSDDQENYHAALKKSNYVRHHDPVVFTAHKDAFAKRNGNKLIWIFLSFAIGSVIWLILLVFPKFHTAAVTKFEKGIRSSDSDFKEMFELLVPKEGFYITPIIMNLNLVVYMLMVFSGLGLVSFPAPDLLRWGANFRPYVADGQYWRLFSSIFLHGGVMHLIANMAGLLFVGIFLEPLLGRKRYALIYLITGIIASGASIFWYPATVSVGASGAIFGLYGLFLGLLLMKVFPKEFNKAFLFSTLVFVGYNLLVGLTGGIDNAAHIGGLLSGFVIGLLLAPSLKRANATALEAESSFS